MGLLNDIYKKLVGSANKSSKSQQSKKNHTQKKKKTTSGGSSKTSGTAQHRGGGSSSKSTTTKSSSGGVQSSRSSSGTQKRGSGSVQSASQKKTGTQQHRSGAVTPVNSRGNERRSGAIRVQHDVSGAIRKQSEAVQKASQKANEERKKNPRNALGAAVKTDTLKYTDKNGKKRTLKSEQLTSEDYLKLQNAARMGGGSIGNKALGKDLAEKIGSRTAYSAGRSTAAKATTGVLQGLAYGDVLHGGVGTYNKDAKGVLKEVKESKSYNIGYGAGQMAGFAASPTSAAGRALAKGVFKGAAKSTAKKIAQNAAMDMAVETPLNLADAMKMSTDENGKVDTKKLVGYMALNTGLTGGAGAGMEALGVGLAKRNVKQISKLKAKIDTGSATLKDVDDYSARLQKLEEAASDTQAAKSGFASEAYDKAYGTTRLGRSEGVELARLTGKKNTPKGLTEAETKRYNELTRKANKIAEDNAVKVAEAKKSIDTKTAALNTLSKTTGVEYKAVDNTEMLKALRENGENVGDDAFVNGVNLTGKDGKRQILINKDSAQAHYTIVGHETTHLLSGTKQFDSLKSSVREFAENTGDYKELRDQMDRIYKSQTKGMSKEEAEAFMDEEITAELVGRYLFRDDVAEDFIRHLANKDRNMLQKVYDYLVNALKGAKSDTEAAQLRTMMEHFDNAFEDMGWSKGSTKFKLSEEKMTLHGGKGSASDYLVNAGLPEAKQLMAQAKKGDAKAIAKLKKTTGWYQSDGKWQFDIDLSNMSFANGIKNLVKKGEAGGDLGEELTGIDPLFKNYPDLEFAMVKFGDTGGAPYKLETGGKNLYGITLNPDLTKKNSLLFKSSGLDKPNTLVNDTMADALQDVISKIDEGKLARSDAENYAEDLFDEEGFKKLTNQSQKPTLKAKAGESGESFEDVMAMLAEGNAGKNQSYEAYKEAFSKEFDKLPAIERVNMMEEYGFHFFKQDEDVDEVLDSLTTEFKKVLEENGNIKPTKKTVKQFTDMMEDDEAADYIAKDAGVSRDKAYDFIDAVKEYTEDQDVMNLSASGTEKVNLIIDNINEYVEKSSAYDLPEGEALYRGVDLGQVGDPEDDAAFEAFIDLLDKMEAGDVFDASMHYKPGTNGVPSSWSIYEKTSKGFAMWNDDEWYSVLGVQHNNITGTPVEHITSVHGEGEVLFGTLNQRTFLGYERVSNHQVIIHVLERAENAPAPRARYSLAEMSGGDPKKLWGHEKPEGTAKPEAKPEEKVTRPMELKGVLDRAKRAPTAEEMNQTAINMINKDMEKYGGDKGFTKMIDDDLGKGMFGKYNKVSREEASATAKKELEDLGYEDMLAKFLKSDFDEDPYVNTKRAVALRNEISRMIDAGEGDVRQLYADSAEIVSKMSSYSGFSSHVMNAMKEFATATPEGRIRTIRNEIARLEKRYADRIKGGKLEIDDAKLEELAEATGRRKDELLDEINKELWDQIPASFMERMNEYRHCFMLFNAKTHGRNVFGNAVFRFARKISDEMESAILNTGAARNRIGKLEGRDASEVVIDKIHVPKKEIKDNIGILENEFHDIYEKSGSRNKYIEMGRPDGVPTVKFKPMQKLIDLNYNALEKEDLKGALKPAFNKAYMSWCKARCPEGTPIREFMLNMTDAQKETARHYALVQGEYATFRDSCAFSDWLIGKKQTFAGKQGNTKWGTFGYRALDTVLEGTIPFVKTPVNIFRRSVDFSPASLVMSLGKLANAKSADEFKLGVHQLCTGLTGTGMMGLGVFLASQGMVTVKAGEESGDAYYDRDMGFQDYSLKIPIGGKEYSWTLDWMAPMGMSLFAGAAFQKMFDKDGFDNTAALNAFFACTSPMTDMSFMSSPKDTIERFMENASRGSGEKETDFAGALAQLIVGDMPKNYVSGFFPQLMAQTAGFIDPVQRDTRSTNENVYLKGWESSARQLANKVPVLRQLILNPKINRKGEDVVTGGNVVTRMVNSFLNPANVKEITENDTDRELIKIRNHIEDKESNDYKFFYYNFTGNPSYNLVNGKRMTYDEAYTYGKANRIEQNKGIKTMLDAPSYKGMTWKMKADEVDDYHWIGTTVADMKTYGANYAMKSMLKNNDKEKESVKEYKRLSQGDGRSASQVNKAYLNYYVDKEKLVARSHAAGDDLYRIKALSAMQRGDKNLLDSLDIQKSKIDDTKKYLKVVKQEEGKDSKNIVFNEVADFFCRIMTNTNKAEVNNPSKGVKSVSAGMVAADGNQFLERTYRGMGYNWNAAQSGAGLMMKYNKDGKYSIEKITDMKNTLRNQFDTNKSGSINKDEVIKYIDSLGIKSDDEKACLYEVLYSGGNYKNPYKAEINDHLKWGENHDDDWGDGKSGGRGYGRGGWGRRGRGGGGGSGSGGAMPETASGAIKGKVSDPFAKTTNGSKDSNLDDAYRKRVKQLRASSRKRPS